MRVGGQLMEVNREVFVAFQLCEAVCVQYDQIVMVIAGVTGLCLPVQIWCRFTTPFWLDVPSIVDTCSRSCELFVSTGVASPIDSRVFSLYNKCTSIVRSRNGVERPLQARMRHE